jgi:hypothetical protein
MTELRSASKEIRDVETVMINDIIDEIISARIDKSDLQNVTMQSLAISLDLNKIFEYYSRGYYTSGSKMNMSGNMISEMHSQYTSSTSISTTTHNNKRINDMHSYNRGLSLTNVTIDRFDNEIKDNLNFTDIGFLETAFSDLRIKLNEKSIPNDISGIIHGQIQPALQRIFKLVME